MRILLSVLLFFLAQSVSSQTYVIDQSIPVKEKDRYLSNAWSGGLNSGQYSTIDINFDGADDLVVFDRTSSKINVFINEDREYKYRPEYVAHFPSGISNWMLLRDYDCDGRKDIFTSDPLGIRVYVNESDADNVKWRLFNSRAPQPSPLLTKGFSASPINIQMNSSDIPSIDDVDDDGDLDILLFRFSSVSTVEFHKNLSMERTASCDSMQFERVTQSWGDFQECNCRSFAFNGEDCPSGGRNEHQSGKSLLTLDLDGDGDLDALIGEEDCGFIHQLPNDGTKDLAVMNKVSINFPNAEESIALSIFPATYYEDVDFDGVKDLIVAPNVPTNVGYGVDFKRSSWFYKNNGTNENPSFSRVQFDFLQDGMLEFGENAVPAFHDYDGDGDLDMFVGSTLENSGRFSSSIRYYKNVGTSSLPEFTLEEEDFLGFSNIGAIGYKPKFMDINKDGLIDLVFSATQTSTFATSIFYLLGRNSSTKFDTQIRQFFGSIGTDENFEIFDVDNDGEFDVLVGQSTGRVEYYRNLGNFETPNFVQEDQSFYDLDFSPFRQNPSIEITDFDVDGKSDMLIGDARGNLTLYNDFLSNLENPVEGQTE
ncbi:MAG: VCBS repeat-containing protein, partial [Fulvivirga sp.]